MCLKIISENIANYRFVTRVGPCIRVPVYHLFKDPTSMVLVTMPMYQLGAYFGELEY